MFNDYDLSKLTKTKNELETLIRNYQMPVNKDLFLIKKLNENDEAENILIQQDTIFIGNNRMQIKKLDGTLEKYNIDKYYPVDEKDEKIKELNQKVEELERLLKDECTRHNGTIKRGNKSNADDDGTVNSKSNTDDGSIQNEE